MKKKIFLILTVISLFGLSIYVAKALDPANPLDSVNILETGETTHGELNVATDNLNNPPSGRPDGSSNVKVRMNFTVDDGYYVDSLTVNYNNNPVELGFEAGAETGSFFRRTAFYPQLNEYEFFIPQEASENNKVEVNIHYARKEAVDVNYRLYVDGDIHDEASYGSVNTLIEGYRDGDIILPESCNDNGCMLVFDFKTKENYNIFKNSPQRDEGDGPVFWYSAGAGLENALIPEQCTEDDGNNIYTCPVVVGKNFKDVSYGNVHLGFNDLNVYATNFLGFDVYADVDNFDDVIFETGGRTVSFSEGNLERNVTAFYGTKTLTLNKKTPKALDKDGDSFCGTLTDFDSVVKAGDGYGYSVSYNNGTGTLTVSIDSYYQEALSLDLILKKNGTNIFGDSNVKINLKRFAFGGNAMQLLEVDSLGRNCGENNNGNTCDQGRYYSTQYRGILSAFYTVPNDPNANSNFTNFYEMTSMNGTEAHYIENDGTWNAYPRNKDFEPYAVALFYDEDDMIVETKTFNLNHDILQEGMITKETFLAKYGSLGLSIYPLERNYVLFGNGIGTTVIEDIEYFDGNHLQGTIMHNLVLIGKDEAEEKGIKKIAMFLVNGEIEETDIPELTFGTGKGVIMEIRGNNPEPPQNNNGGGND